jgi:hypothetical protein
VVDAALDLAGELMHGKELQVDSAAMAVVVADVGDVGANGCANPQFLIQFAGQRLLRALAGLDLAAGKLPQQRHRLIGTALADQHQAITNDQGRRHKAQRRTGRPRIIIRLSFSHTFSLIAPDRVQSSSLAYDGTPCEQGSPFSAQGSPRAEHHSPATAASTPSAVSGRK